MDRSRAHAARLLAASLVLGSIGCNEDRREVQAAPEASPSSIAAPKNTAACDDDHREAIERELLAHCEISDKLPRVDVPMAPFAATPTTAPQRGRIELGPGKITTGWGEETSVEDVVDELTAAHDAAELRGQPFEGWVLVIANETPSSEVVAVFRALSEARQRQGRLVLAVEPPKPVPQPRDPARLKALRAEVGSDDPSQRATAIARTLSDAMPPCKPMIEAFSKVATVGPDEKCSVLARGLSEGLVSCGCLEEDEILTLVYGVNLDLAPPTRLTTVVPVNLDPNAQPRSGVTWGEIVAHLDRTALEHLWIDG